MPRVDDSSGTGPGYRLPGVYRRLLERKIEDDTRPDPRLALTEGKAYEDYERAVEDGQRKAVVLFKKGLSAGEPLTVARWEVVGGHHGIPRDEVPPLWDSVRSFNVFPDDTIKPAEPDV